MNPQKSKQQGVALIVVLLIVAIVSVLATEMGSRLQLQVKRASNIKENNQAYWYAMGAEQYARKSIKQLMVNDGKVIHLEQPWNQEFVYPIEGGGIQAQLIDMQSCFNLNALRVPADNPSGGGEPLLPDRMLAFERLLQNVDPAIPSYNIDILRDSLVDWLDQDDRQTGYGAEDSEYESLQFPYVAANNFMVHKSELRLIHGVEVSWLRELLKLVCVLPNDSLFLININTVSEENAAVIAAATGLPLSDAQSLLANRGSEGYQTTEAFFNDPSIQALEPRLSEEQKKWFDVKTSHFILHTKTKYNEATFSMKTLFKVDSSNNVNIIRRDFGGF
ncbi:type II secretion system minor pseudopilin GspK [Paraglaciecola arctica]|uniref:Type II secretion system protein K n=1 Tax=Paraglaciecola arctica BSs20135 TaxID=493475 RepID=K6XBD0_9ALTE|nr:type II secretion system minor pseudopilin GspK [Paraglaciecola arctica]GAC17924.1 general secretion pathway protein K [Paraglaciecola arctica BSs20135]